ncbi:MAG: hypothetical protein KatS3mg026_1425 [Bacteroidia bacterium]|nr:MAG: hypothetical protein KatS3mg026_1425 [Bacteroidia bacterium]
MTWEDLLKKVEKKFGLPPSEEALLFLIGLNELGTWPAGEERQVKADLIRLGTAVLLCRAGYLERVGTEAEGWPIYQRKALLPPWPAAEQRRFLREAILHYFAEIGEL